MKEKTFEQQMEEKFYPNGKDGDFVLDETFYGGKPDFSNVKKDKKYDNTNK